MEILTKVKREKNESSKILAGHHFFEFNTITNYILKPFNLSNMNFDHMTSCHVDQQEQWRI